MIGIASRIDAVTVYRRGARVRRVAELAREADGFPASVRLGGLPLGLDDSSVRVSLTGDGPEGSLPIASDLRVALEVPAPDPDLRPADDTELEAARHEVRRLEARVAHVGREIGRLEAMALPARPAGAEGEPPQESPTAARLALVAFRGRREQTLRDELRRASRDLDAARRRRDQLEDRNRRTTGARQAREHELRKTVVISLRERTAGAARARVVLEYLVPGAAWAPSYAIRFDRGLTGARLALRALVAQRSGEDWNGVALTLSTAEATRWTELPELPSRRIGRRQAPPLKRGWRPPPAGAEELYRDWDRAFRGRFAAPPEPAPAQTIAADLEEELAEVPPVAGEAMAEDEDTLVLRTGAAPPSLPPPPMPPPLGLPPPQMMMKRSAAAAPARVAAAVASAPVALAAKGLGALFGGGADQPAPGAPPMPREQAAAEPAAIGAADPLLRYGQLRMPPARSPRRGRLVIATRRELYLSLLVDEQIEVSFDVLATVDQARRQAGIVGGLPPGAELAWSDSYDHAYTASAPVDVPADGEFHAVPLLERDAAARPLHVVVPRESTDVFRTAELDNPLDAPLLRGPVDIYVDGDFLLTGRLDFTPPGGRLALGLGVEQGIKVARNARFREETGGLMGGKLSLHHQLLVELRNNLDRPARIEVRERLPVTREGEEELEVKEALVSPAWEEWTQEARSAGEPELQGGRRWLVTVPAGAREELRAEYEIRLSGKHELVGGNRREA